MMTPLAAESSISKLVVRTAYGLTTETELADNAPDASASDAAKAGNGEKRLSEEYIHTGLFKIDKPHDQIASGDPFT
eukprot:scaffold31990_cov95-Cyclotella_meneghiniana.AAC.1